MRNAPTTHSSESALDKRHYTAGSLPARLNTVQSAALACLLEGQRITSMDSVWRMSTTRLAAVVHRLSTYYGWHIQRAPVAAGTNDGRIAWVTAYWLSQEVIKQAFEIGAQEWIVEVKAARAEQRQQSAKCKADATRMNAARKQAEQSSRRERSLWSAK